MWILLEKREVSQDHDGQEQENPHHDRGAVAPVFADFPTASLPVGESSSSPVFMNGLDFGRSLKACGFGRFTASRRGL